MGDNSYKQLAQTAYDAVADLKGDEQFKIEGYKIILAALVGGTIGLTQGAEQEAKKVSGASHVGDTSWQGKVAAKLDLTVEQVSTIYHLDGENLKIIIDHKRMPKSASQSTQHVAALLAAGRQALGLDENNATAYDLIRLACKDYGCFNAKNFTSYVKLLGSKFIYTGTGANQALQLTYPAFGIAGTIAKNYVEAE